jgi:cell division protein FtsL
MIKLVNVLLIAAVLFSGAKLYSLEHETRRLERQTAKLQAELLQQKEDRKLLRAEWASLTRPERIEKLALEKLDMAPVRVTQIVTEAELPERIVALRMALDAAKNTEAGAGQE